MERDPDLELKVWLSEIGIEAHITHALHGLPYCTHETCRDFRNDRPIDESKAILLNNIYTALNMLIRENRFEDTVECPYCASLIEVSVNGPDEEEETTCSSCGKKSNVSMIRYLIAEEIWEE